MPNFLKFCLAYKNLQNFVISRKCEQSLLQREINNKKSHLRTLQNEFNCLRSDLQFRLNYIDFAHISTFLVSSNDNLLKTNESVQQKKFNKLLIENKLKKDPEKLIRR